MREITVYQLIPRDGDGRSTGSEVVVFDPAEVAPKIDEIMGTKARTYKVDVVPEKRNVLEPGDELNLQVTGEYGGDAILMDEHTEERPFIFCGLDVTVKAGYRIVPQTSDENGDIRIFRVVKV